MNPPVTPSRSYAESLSGLVERVTYFNEENGFAVLKVKVKGHRDPVTIVDVQAEEIEPREEFETHQ